MTNVDNKTMTIEQFYQWFLENQHKLPQKQVRQIKKFLRENMEQKGGQNE